VILVAKQRFYDNPKDLLNETYNADKFPLADKTANAWVMPLDMVQDVDALAYDRFYNEEWNKIINDINKKQQ